MNPRSTYAFYGSLRRGMTNYHFFEKGLEFLYEESIPGYQLYAMKAYPYAIKTGNPSDVLMVEIFKAIDPEVERAIHDLEMRVGYFYDELLLRGESVGIYLFERAGPDPLVKSGDWVKFFGS